MRGRLPSLLNRNGDFRFVTKLGPLPVGNSPLPPMERVGAVAKTRGVAGNSRAVRGQQATGLVGDRVAVACDQTVRSNLTHHVGHGQLDTAYRSAGKYKSAEASGSSLSV